LKYNIEIDKLLAPCYYESTEKFLTEHPLYTLYFGGRGSRKGTTAYTEAFVHGLLKPTGILVYVGVAESIEQGVLAQILEVADRIEETAGINPIKSIKKRPYEVTLVNGSKIFFSGLSKPEDAKGKVGLPKIDLVICDEVGDYKNEEYFNTMLKTFLRNPNIKFIIVGNPPRNQNHFIYDFIKDKQDNANYLHTTYLDLPQDTIPESMLMDIEDEKIKNPKQYAFDWLGEPVGLDGLAHPHVDDSILINQLPLQTPRHRVLSIDFGESDATASLLFYLYDDKTMVLFDTLYHDCKELGPTNLASLPSKYEQRFGRGLDAVIVDSRVASNYLQHKYNSRTENITEKERTKVLNWFNLVVQNGNFKIYDTPDNRIVYNQLRNAEIDNSSGVEKIKKSKTARDKNRHDHGADAARYAVLKYGKG
jgi:PBSX family phage terminase large subunit